MPVAGDHRNAREQRSTLVLLAAPRSRALGVLAAALAVGATTLLIYPLREVAPAISTSVLYLVAVVVPPHPGSAAR